MYCFSLGSATNREPITLPPLGGVISAIPEGTGLGDSRCNIHISAWSLLLGGIGLLTGYGVYQVARALFAEGPLLVNVGITAAAVGGLLLLIIAIRERFAERRNEHFRDE